MLDNCARFLKVYQDVWGGAVVSPRGAMCREVEDYTFELDMADNPLTSFSARNLNLRYAKEEFKWYLRGDKFDDSIEKFSTAWKKIKQPDGSFFSNYGQYIFPDQFRFVVNELTRDRFSRRASIALLRQEHLFHKNTDVVCTYSINFRIRGGALNMSVNMRSNDVIFGMTNDVFCFSMLYRMVHALLGLQKIGVYRHKVDSLHVYEKHFTMIESIIREGRTGYLLHEIPWPTEKEVREALAAKRVVGEEGWARWMSSEN